MHLSLFCNNCRVDGVAILCLAARGQVQLTTSVTLTVPTHSPLENALLVLKSSLTIGSGVKVTRDFRGTLEITCTNAVIRYQ